MTAEIQAIKIKPASFYISLILFGASSLLFFLFLYIILPSLSYTGASWFLIYNISLVMPMAILLIAALIGYKFEGLPFTWPSIFQRFRLKPMKTDTWFWAITLCVFMYGGEYSLPVAFMFAWLAIIFERAGNRKSFWLTIAFIILFLAASYTIWQTEPWLGKIILHQKPSSFIQFLKHFGPKDFMGITLYGKWWVIVYYIFILLVFNIGGEELWWRGYILPRQEPVFGKMTWIVHGILWASFHLFLQSTLYDLVRMIPTCCALAFVVQRTRNTWTGIVGHTIGNSPLLLQIMHGVFYA
jgi:membrane protease YdiL (CAAX protease family)